LRRTGIIRHCAKDFSSNVIFLTSNLVRPGLAFWSDSQGSLNQNDRGRPILKIVTIRSI
jgi:hypothetical protein